MSYMNEVNLCKSAARGWQWARRLRPWIALLVFGHVAACFPLDHTTIAPPQTPPQAILESSLVGTQWQLVEVSIAGQEVPVGAAVPIHLLFNRNGVLEVNSQPCGRGSYDVVFLGGQRFQLTNPTFLEIDCRDPARTHFNVFVDALEATDAYALLDTRLVLHGAEIELHLIAED